MKTVRDILGDRERYYVAPDITVQEAVRYMTERKIGAIPIIQDEILVGVFSERDLMKRVVAKGLKPEDVKIEEVMTRQVICCSIDDTYEDCLKKMTMMQCRHAPILDGNRLLGQVSIRDLLDLDVEQKGETIKLMETYMHGIPPQSSGS